MSADVSDICLPRGRGKGELPVEPLQRWIEERRSHYGSLAALARRVGVSPERLRTIALGRAYHGGKRYVVRRVTLDFADRILMAEGSTQLWELWPSMPEPSPSRRVISSDRSQAGRRT